MDVKDRIREIIEKENMSQAEFSRATDINTSTLSHVLTGRNKASIEVINKILTTFPKYNNNWLVNGVGEPILTTTSQSVVKNDHDGNPSTMMHHTPTALRLSLFDNRTNPTDEKQSEYMTHLNTTDETSSIDMDGDPHNSQTSQVRNLHPYMPPAREFMTQTEKIKVQKIIIYYEDNTFETFIPEKER